MLDQLKRLPADSTLALIDMCRNDPNPEKIDVGIGVFKDEHGHTPILKVVKQAEQLIHEKEHTKTYVSTTGDAVFCERMLETVIGAKRAQDISHRFSTSQAAGGSGALSIGAHLIKNANAKATVWISNPSWVNHYPLLGSSGLEIREYPYYDTSSMGLKFEEMLNHLDDQCKKDDVIVLHGCCHNPTGVDLNLAQWHQLAQLMLDRQLLPLVDLAYFGLGNGLEADTEGVGVLLDQLPEVIIAASCSKNFAIYRERVGFFAALSRNANEAKAAQSNLGAIQRRMISMPPNHGAAVVSHVLGDEQLNKQWKKELRDMRERISGLRIALSTAFSKHDGGSAIGQAIQNQNGMFSLLPISVSQADSLRRHHSIYLTDDGRINIAGANQSNIERFAKAVMQVLSDASIQLNR